MTQVGAQNEDFGAVLQTDLTRVKFGLWHWLVHGHSSHVKIHFCKAKSLPIPFSVVTLGTDNCLLHPSGGGEGGFEGGIYF